MSAIVLGGCATVGRVWWGWISWDWARLVGASSRSFRDAQPLPTDTTVRPCLLALAYLLGGFTDYQHVGNFNRLHLAHLVFGEQPITAAMQTVSQNKLAPIPRMERMCDPNHSIPNIEIRRS